MKKKKLSKLAVIEIPYGDIGWGTSPGHEWEGVRSDIQHWKKYRELDDYRLCGVYTRAEVPYCVDELVLEQPVDNEVYLALAKKVSDIVSTHLEKGEAVLAVGGYCRDAVGICGGIQRAFGKDTRIGIVYLDAHSDMASPEITKSGILGGMDLNCVLGLSLPEWREAAYLEKPVEAGNVILGDFRNILPNEDDGTSELVRKLDIVLMGPDIFCDEQAFRAQVESLAERVDIIYLHIDEDVLDKKYAPNAWCLSEIPGPSVELVNKHIKTVMNTGKVAVFSVLDVYFELDENGQEQLP